MCCCAVWGPHGKVELLGLMQDLRKAIAPNDSYFADVTALANCDLLVQASKSAGFATAECR
jgi:hypothetical protein